MHIATSIVVNAGMQLKHVEFLAEYKHEKYTDGRRLYVLSIPDLYGDETVNGVVLHVTENIYGARRALRS